MTPRKYFEDNQTLTLFRITIVSLFAVRLSVSISLAGAFVPFYFIFYAITDKLLIALAGIEFFLSIMPILWTFWARVLAIFLLARLL